MQAIGTNPQWYDVPAGGSPIATGLNFTTPLLTESTTYYVSDLQEFVAGAYEVGKEEHTSFSEYNGDNFNGQIIFNVYEPILLKQVTVYTDTPGERRVQLLDQSENVLQEVAIVIAEGTSVVDLNMMIDPGFDYRLTTSTEFNQQQFGTNSPRLQRDDEDTSYPYLVNDVVELYTSQFGDDFYYYFYDWQIEQLGLSCESERVPVEIVIVSTDVLAERNYRVYPNPSPGSFEIEFPFELPTDAAVEISTVNAQRILAQSQQLRGSTLQVELGKVSPGVYLVSIVAHNQIHRVRAVVE